MPVRRDYFIKLVQELSAVLLQIVSLKARREYAAALAEIDAALQRFLKLEPGGALPENLDHVLELCAAEDGLTTESLSLLGNLFYEQGAIFSLEKNEEGRRRAELLSLGLYLESVGKGFVSLDLLEKIDALIEGLEGDPIPTPVLRRLFRYLEDRALYATAEDALYEWLDREDPTAISEGIAFYERLLAKSDAELAQGNLPRAEVEEGRGELLQRHRAGPGEPGGVGVPAKLAGKFSARRGSGREGPRG